MPNRPQLKIRPTSYNSMCLTSALCTENLTVCTLTSAATLFEDAISVLHLSEV